MSYLNDGTNDAPKLRVYLNTDNLYDLPAHSSWQETNTTAAIERLKADGFEGVQIGGAVELYDGAQIPHSGLGRINLPEEADPLLAERKARGDNAVTLHVGWGMESDAEMDRLVDAVLSASAKHNIPAFIETHRATITQDMWRTVELCKRIPEVRFNGDFSHFYCGQEMPYGDFDGKLDFMQPIFDRVGYMHGRIAASGMMQAAIDNTTDKPRLAQGDARDYLADFKSMWRRAMTGFKKNASAGDVLIFAPELLTPIHYYARIIDNGQGQLIEEGDRYAQALLHAQIARECFAASE